MKEKRLLPNLVGNQKNDTCSYRLHCCLTGEEVLPEEPGRGETASPLLRIGGFTLLFIFIGLNSSASL